ncbi:hypothetical protein [Geomicrobium sp. JCM 19039]|uniref:hypothetical protein n=1 Tax=Geomicrobium sp. JCM 19039 TaxID=1460636 RepID=UPI00045F258E|nr:hypothetical protein [Geomicrobium sp. JCM 19039]GAK14556.1 hypothetical protein JCM19039_4487 [Geomicrobium sp. JCM 19039]
MQSKGSSGRCILLFILGTTLISGCLDAEEVDVDVYPEEVEDDVEQTNESEQGPDALDEESFIQRVVEALADADEDYLNTNIQSSMIETNEEMIDRLYQVFASADVSSINVYEQQGDLEDNQVEYEVVIRARFTDLHMKNCMGKTCN